MVSSGRISVLVSKDLQTLLSAVRELPAEVTEQIRAHTKGPALPIWQESTRGHVSTRLQSRVLGDTARVAVSDSNVTLKAGGIGKLSSGVAIPTIALAAEFGANPAKQITQHSRKGKSYKRRRGDVFGLPRAQGNVAYPAARDTIPRIASLWVQTTVRTIHEVFERGGA